MARNAAEDRLTKMRERMNQSKHKSQTSSGNFWKPDEGKSVIRILPPVGKMGFFWQEVGKHSLSDDVTVICPNFTTDGELPCPICEASHEAYIAKDKELGGQLKVRRYYYMSVMVRTQDDNDKMKWDGPFSYTPGVKLFENLSSIVADPEYGDVSDAQNGYTLKLTRNGTGMDTTYQVMPSRDPSPLASNEEELKEILGKAVDHSAILDSLPSYEELSTKLGLAPVSEGEYEPAGETEDEEF